MNHSTGKPTKSQSERLEILSGMPCMCCEIEAVRQPSRTEIHHLVDKGTRALSGGHDATIPLCAWHHRGECAEGLTSSEMLFAYGPSLGRNKKVFVTYYGPERSLLQTINEQLQVAA